MANPNFPGELQSIPYQAIIGGPLEASVKANAKASETAANFIERLGFEHDDQGNITGVRTVSFSYKKLVEDGGSETEKEYNLSLPFLLLLNVPYFEVSNVTIDFHVKLNSIEKRKTSTKLNVDASVEGKHGWLMGSVEFKVSSSYQRTSKHSKKVERQYDQNVHVVAESVDAPVGVQRLVGALEESIRDEPSSS